MSHMCPVDQEGAMVTQGIEAPAKVATFGRRKVTPRVCVADSKQHIRAFLAETLEDLGFVTCECPQVSDLGAVLDAHLPDLLVVGLSAGGDPARELFETLAAKQFDGKVLLLGPRNSL